MTPLWRDEPRGGRLLDAGPWLVCLDLQREFVSQGRPLHSPGVENRLGACAGLLAHARDAGWPVIHAHRRRDSGLFSDRSEFSRPIEGLEPLVSEALFFRSQMSAFAAPGLRRMAPPTPGTRVFVAALSLDNACLATVLQGADLGLKITVAEDLLGASPLGPYAPGVVAGVAKRMIAPFARFEPTQALMRPDRVERRPNLHLTFEGNESWPA